MRTVGVICEYNPFHHGHLTQFRQIRTLFGEDAAIICLMSGNFVQRGECAVFDKLVRASAAVDCGARLVLELPVTKALCSAEGFARGGVEIFTKLGIIDTLAFGCESGDGQAIFTAAQAMCAASYDRALREILDTGASYPAARQREAIGLDGKILEKPNDILALEYCKALLQMESRIQPLALLREGDYHAEKADPDNPSATSLRTRLLSGEDLSPFAPQTAMEAYRSARPYALSSGELAMLAGLRLLSDEAWQQTAHGSEGLWSKAMKAAREKGSLEEIIGAVKSRRYPRTRIQRLLLCAFLKISQEDLQLPVCHVRALAFDDTGKALLRRMRAEGQLPVVNAGEKPPASALFDLEVRAGRLYPLFCRDDTIPDGNAEENLRIFLKK